MYSDGILFKCWLPELCGTASQVGCVQCTIQAAIKACFLNHLIFASHFVLCLVIYHNYLTVSQLNPAQCACVQQVYVLWCIHRNEIVKGFDFCPSFLPKDGK